MITFRVFVVEHPAIVRERRQRIRQHVSRCWRGRARRRALEVLS